MAQGKKKDGMGWAMALVWIAGILGLVVAVVVAIWAYAAGGFMNLISGWYNSKSADITRTLDMNGDV